jgi:chromosome segregation ATPase
LQHRSPLYLLDEIDAALDETNQMAVAQLIRAIFSSSQVLCVSHHKDFQLAGTSLIDVFMKDGKSIISSARYK